MMLMDMLHHSLCLHKVRQGGAVAEDGGIQFLDRHVDRPLRAPRVGEAYFSRAKLGVGAFEHAADRRPLRTNAERYEAQA